MRTIYLSLFDGDDSLDGQSEDTGYKTLAKALATVRSFASEECKIEVSGEGNVSVLPDSVGIGWAFVGIKNLTILTKENIILDGKGKCKHVVYLRDCENVKILNFTVTGGYSKDSVGAGVCLTHSNGCLIDCRVTKNQAIHGGGVYVGDGGNNTISGAVFNNSAEKGEGLFIKGDNNRIKAVVIDNNSGENSNAIFVSGINNIFESSQNTNDVSITGDGRIVRRSDISGRSFFEGASLSKENEEEPEGPGTDGDLGLIYVAMVKGDNSRDGLSRATSVRTMDAAISVMKRCHFNHVEIRLYDSGVYKISSDNNSSCWSLIRLHDLTIVAIDDIVLDGDEKCEHVLYMKNCNNVTVRNLVLTGGLSANGVGAGLYMLNCTGCMIDCLIQKNSAPSGGGVYLEDSIENEIAGIVSKNNADLGGGIVLFGEANRVSGMVINNTAKLQAGGVMICENGNTVSGTISKNKASSAGGMVINSCRNFISGIINYNTADFCGGIYLDPLAEENELSGVVSGNTAQSGYGGGVVMSNKRNIVTGNIVDNKPDNITHK